MMKWFPDENSLNYAAKYSIIIPYVQIAAKELKAWK